jgi:Na+/H+-dicarboxylate symporter
VFLAQVFGVELGLPTLALIVATAVGASIGSPGVPGVGMGILAMILSGAGIPNAGIPLVMGVDRIVDMMRTVVNVTGDLVACVLFDRAVPEPAAEVAAAPGEL